MYDYQSVFGGKTKSQMDCANAFGSIIKDGDVAGSNGPKGDCAATSCTICPNGDTNGIGESNTNANTITAYM